MGIYLSPKYGVNPGLEQCFVCMKDVGVILWGANRGQEAPRRACIDREPCAECKGLMEQGIILISVDEKKSEGDMQNPYRTGGWVVVREEFVRRVFDGPILDPILKYRMAFIEDDAWDKLCLPRGGVNAQTLPREGDAPAGEEREVVGDLVDNDWRVFPRTKPLDLATDEEREGVKMIIFLQAMAGLEETEAEALVGWRKMTDEEKARTHEMYAYWQKNKPP